MGGAALDHGSALRYGCQLCDTAAALSTAARWSVSLRRGLLPLPPLPRAAESLLALGLAALSGNAAATWCSWRKRANFFLPFFWAGHLMLVSWDASLAVFRAFRVTWVSGGTLCLSLSKPRVSPHPHFGLMPTAYKNWSISGLGHLIGFHVFCGTTRDPRRDDGGPTPAGSSVQPGPGEGEPAPRGARAAPRRQPRAQARAEAPKAGSAERRALRNLLKALEGPLLTGGELVVASKERPPL